MTAHDHNPADLLAFFRQARSIADAAYPGCRRLRLVLVTCEGEEAVIPIPMGHLPGVANGHGHAADPETTESAILRVLRDAESPLTGEEIAAKTDYQFNSRFKRILAEMVGDGRIENGRPGYRVSGA